MSSRRCGISVGASLLALPCKLRWSAPITTTSGTVTFCRTPPSSRSFALDFLRHRSHQSCPGETDDRSAVERSGLTARRKPSLRTNKTGRSEAVPRTTPLRPSRAEQLRRFDSVIPQQGCVPAEPASASPSDATLPPTHVLCKRIQEQQAPPVPGRVGLVRRVTVPEC